MAKLPRLTYKIAIQLHLVAAISFAVLAPGSQSGNFWLYRRISKSRGDSLRNFPNSSQIDYFKGSEIFL